MKGLFNDLETLKDQHLKELADLREALEAEYQLLKKQPFQRTHLDRSGSRIVRTGSRGVLPCRPTWAESNARHSVDKDPRISVGKVSKSPTKMRTPSPGNTNSSPHATGPLSLVNPRCMRRKFAR